MKHLVIFLLLLVTLLPVKNSGQIIEQIKKDMPSYLSVLFEWGQRPSGHATESIFIFCPVTIQMYSELT